MSYRCCEAPISLIGEKLANVVIQLDLCVCLWQLDLTASCDPNSPCDDRHAMELWLKFAICILRIIVRTDTKYWNCIFTPVLCVKHTFRLRLQQFYFLISQLIM